MLPNVGRYIYSVKISGFTRSSIYIHDISRLRVKDILTEKCGGGVLCNKIVTVYMFYFFYIFWADVPPSLSLSLSLSLFFFFKDTWEMSTFLVMEIW